MGVVSVLEKVRGCKLKFRVPWTYYKSCWLLFIMVGFQRI